MIFLHDVARCVSQTSSKEVQIRTPPYLGLNVDQSCQTSIIKWANYGLLQIEKSLDGVLGI